MLESTSRLCSFKIIKMIIVSLIYFTKINYFSAEKTNKIDQGSISVKTLLILEDGLPGFNSSQDPKYGLGRVLALWVVRGKYNPLTPISKATSPLVRESSSWNCPRTPFWRS